MEKSLSEQARKEIVENPSKIYVPFSGDVKFHRAMRAEQTEAVNDGDYIGALSAYLSEGGFYLMKYSSILGASYFAYKSLENIF